MNAVPSFSLLRPSRLRFGPFVLDRGRRALFCGEELRHVQPRVYDLLELLLSRAGQVVTKQELLDQVWGGRPLTDSALTQAVAELRRALGEGDEGGCTIVTVHRVGYRFEGTVEALPEPVVAAQVLALPNGTRGANELASASVAVEPIARPPRSSSDAARRYSIGAALLLALLLGVGWWWQANRTPVDATPQRLGLAPVRIEPADSAAAEVLDSAIWERLRRLGGIEVVRLALDVSDAPDPVAEAALLRQLRLQTVLRPRLQVHSDRTEVELVFGAASPASQRTTLAKGADAQVIAAAIEAEVVTRYRLPPPPKRDARHVDPGSEQLRLQGEGLLMRRQRAKAIERFEQALALDPNNAAAQAGLAVALATSAGIGMAQDEAVARARRHAHRALALSPDNAAAHAALGLIAMHDGGGGVDTALIELDRALALDPGYSDAWMWRSMLNHPALSLSTRIHDLERALALDPAHHIARSNLAISYLAAGQTGAAQALLAPSANESEAASHALAYARAGVVASSGRPEVTLAQLLRLYPEHVDPRVIAFRLGPLIALDDVDFARRLLDDRARHVHDDALGTLRLLPPLSELGDGERIGALIARLPPNSTERVLSPGSSLQEWRGVAAAYARDWPVAIANLAPTLETPGSLAARKGSIEIVLDFGAWLLYALRESGDTTRAAAVHARIADFIRVQRAGGYGDSSSLLFAEARLAAVTGNNDLALKRLQRAFDAGARRAENLRRDPRWDALRSDSRFVELLQRSTDAAAAARERLAALPEGATLEAWRLEVTSAKP